MKHSLIMENWRRYLQKQPAQIDMGHLYLIEGRKIKKVSFEKRFNQLNESKGDLENFLKEWEKSCNHTFRLLEQKEQLNEADLQYKIGVQILMMISRIKKWSMKVIMPILRVIAKISPYMNKSPILKTIAKVAVILIVIGATSASAHAGATDGNDFGPLIDWIQENSDLFSDEFMNEIGTIQDYDEDGVLTPYDLKRYIDVEDLTRELATAKSEADPEELERYKRVMDTAMGRVQDAVDSAPSPTAEPQASSTFNYDLAAGQLQAGDSQSKAEWAQRIIQANDKTGGAPEELLKKAKEILEN